MDKMEQLFALGGIRRGGILLLTPADALAFVDAAKLRRNPILGIESFVLTESTTRPVMEHILDLSLAPSTTDTWSEASLFIEERGSCGFHFEITI